METDLLDISTSDFWEGDETIVFQNPRASKPVGDLRKVPAGSLLFPTSGSTGQPKWVVTNRAALLASAEAVNRHLRCTWHDRWACVLPTFHVGGLGIFARSYLLGCAPVVREGKWNAESFNQMLAHAGVTLTSLVPAQVHDICHGNWVCPESVRVVVVGGGALSASVHAAALKLGWPLAPSFGMTEAGSQIATAEPGGNSMQVLACWEAATNEFDCLKIRGLPLFQGYFFECEKGWEFLPGPDEDGWFTSSDIVHLGTNTLTWKGRRDRVVKVLGELVNLDQVEADISARTSAHFTVLPKLDERAGSRLLLVGEGELSHWEEIRDAYNSDSAPIARIQDVRAVATLPRSPLGKVVRGEIPL